MLHEDPGKVGRLGPHCSGPSAGARLVLRRYHCEHRCARSTPLRWRRSCSTRSRRGTVHFHYLLEGNGGCVRTADSLEEHATQLGALLARDPDATRDRNAAFVTQFVRGGLVGKDSTPRMVQALEAAGGTWVDRARRRWLPSSPWRKSLLLTS